jgi:hypothetical protein
VDGLEIDLGLYPALFIAKPLPCFLRYRSARLRDRLRPGCSKRAFLLGINLYPWCSIFWLPCILNPPPWWIGMGPCGANSAIRERRCVRLQAVHGVAQSPGMLDLMRPYSAFPPARRPAMKKPQRNCLGLAAHWGAWGPLESLTARNMVRMSQVS